MAFVPESLRGGNYRLKMGSWNTQLGTELHNPVEGRLYHLVKGIQHQRRRKPNFYIANKL